MLKEYEINEATQAIIPIDNDKSMVYENDTEYVVNMPSNKIINYNCSFYGSSYIGRCEGTKSLAGIKTKLPIIIEESRNIIFFPTGSTRSKQTEWFSLNNIKSIKQYPKDTVIVFNNGHRLHINTSYYSMNNQLCRAKLLQGKLYERKLQNKDTLNKEK